MAGGYAWQGVWGACGEGPCMIGGVHGRGGMHAGDGP